MSLYVQKKFLQEYMLNVNVVVVEQRNQKGNIYCFYYRKVFKICREVDNIMLVGRERDVG